MTTDICESNVQYKMKAPKLIFVRLLIQPKCQCLPFRRPLLYQVLQLRHREFVLRHVAVHGFNDDGLGFSAHVRQPFDLVHYNLPP
jgi:hypothetical protein